MKNNKILAKELKNQKEKEYYWSFDESFKKDGENPKNWNEPCDSIKMCIDWAKDCLDFEHESACVYIGYAKQIVPDVNILAMIEESEDRVKEQDEHGYLDDWEICSFNENMILDELDEKVNRVFKEWVEKYDRLPNLYEIVDIKEYELRG